MHTSTTNNRVIEEQSVLRLHRHPLYSEINDVIGRKNTKEEEDILKSNAGTLVAMTTSAISNDISFNSDTSMTLYNNSEPLDPRKINDSEFLLRRHAYFNETFYPGPTLKSLNATGSVIIADSKREKTAYEAFSTLTFLRPDKEVKETKAPTITEIVSEKEQYVNSDLATTVNDILDDPSVKIQSRLHACNASAPRERYLKNIQLKLQSFDEQKKIGVPDGFRLIKKDEISSEHQRSLSTEEMIAIKGKMKNHILQFLSRIEQPTHSLTHIPYQRTIPKKVKLRVDTGNNAITHSVNNSMNDFFDDDQRGGDIPFYIPKSPMLAELEKKKLEEENGKLTTKSSPSETTTKTKTKSKKHKSRKKGSTKGHMISYDSNKPELLEPMSGSIRCAVMFQNEVWSSRRDGTITIRHHLTGDAIQSFTGDFLVSAMTVVGDQIWAGTQLGQIMIFNGYNKRQEKRLTLHAGSVLCLDSNAYGVWSGSSDFTINRWSLDGKHEMTYLGHTLGVKCILCFGYVKMWTGSDDKTIRVWDLETSETLYELTEHTASVLCMVSTGEIVLSGSEDGEILMWNVVGKPTCLRRIQVANSARVNHMSLVGPQLWTCGQSSCIDIWDAKSMDYISSMPAHKSFVNALISVQLVETRQVWSYSVGEDNVVRWKSKIVTNDIYNELAQKTAEVFVVTERAVEIKQRLHEQTLALKKLEARSERASELMLQEISVLVQKLAEAEFWKTDMQRVISELKNNMRETLDQNEALKDDVQLLLNDRKKDEQVHRKLLSRINQLEIQSDANDRAHEKKIAALQSKLDSRQQAFDKEKKEISAQISHQHGKKQAQMVKQIEDLERKLAASKLTEQKQHTEMENLREHAEFEHSERERLRKRLTECDKHDVLVEEIQQEQQKVTKLNDVISDLKQNITRQNETIAFLTEECEDAKMKASEWKQKYEELEIETKKIVKSHNMEVQSCNKKLKKQWKENERIRVVHNTIMYRLDRVAREVKQLETDLSYLSDSGIETKFIPITVDNWERRNIQLTEEFNALLLNAKQFASEISSHCFINVQKYHVGTPSFLDPNVPKDETLYWNSNGILKLHYISEKSTAVEEESAVESESEEEVKLLESDIFEEENKTTDDDAPSNEEKEKEQETTQEISIDDSDDDNHVVMRKKTVQSFHDNAISEEKFNELKIRVEELEHILDIKEQELSKIQNSHEEEMTLLKDEFSEEEKKFKEERNCWKLLEATNAKKQAAEAKALAKLAAQPKTKKQQEEHLMFMQMSKLRRKEAATRIDLSICQRELKEQKEAFEAQIKECRNTINELTVVAEQAEFKNALVQNKKKMKYMESQMKMMRQKNEKLQICMKELEVTNDRLKSDLYVESLTLRNYQAKAERARQSNDEISQAVAIVSDSTDNSDHKGAHSSLLIQANEKIKQYESMLMKMKKQRDQMRIRDRGLYDQIRAMKIELHDAKSTIKAYQKADTSNQALLESVKLGGDIPVDSITPEMVKNLRVELVKMKKREEGFKSQNIRLRNELDCSEKEGINAIMVLKDQQERLNEQLKQLSEELVETYRVRQMEEQYGLKAKYIPPSAPPKPIPREKNSAFFSRTTSFLPNRRTTGLIRPRTTTPGRRKKNIDS